MPIWSNGKGSAWTYPFVTTNSPLKRQLKRQRDKSKCKATRDKILKVKDLGTILKVMEGMGWMPGTWPFKGCPLSVMRTRGMFALDINERSEVMNWSLQDDTAFRCLDEFIKESSIIECLTHPYAYVRECKKYYIEAEEKKRDKKPGIYNAEGPDDE